MQSVKDEYYKTTLKEFREIAKNYAINIVTPKAGSDTEGDDDIGFLVRKSKNKPLKEIIANKQRQPRTGEMFYIYPFNPNCFRRGF